MSHIKRCKEQGHKVLGHPPNKHELFGLLSGHMQQKSQVFTNVEDLLHVVGGNNTSHTPNQQKCGHQHQEWSLLDLARSEEDIGWGKY